MRNAEKRRLQPTASVRLVDQSAKMTFGKLCNARKPRCVRVPEEPVAFLGYREGRNYRPQTGEPYLVTRPSAGSVRSVCRRISELKQARYGLLDEGEMVRRLNLERLGWANYFYRG